MSLRQIRRVQQLASSGDAATHESVHSDSLGGEEQAVVPRKSVFKKLQDSDSSSSSSSSESECEIVVEPPIMIQAASSTSKAPSQTPKPSRRQKKVRADEKHPSVDTRKSVLDDALDLNVRLLNPSSELRRIFGRSAVPAAGASRPNRLISKRKHWLIEPEVNWPLVVPFCFKMELCGDGSFRFVPENDYERKLEILARIVVTHDIEALYHFVELNPFNPHGLIQLASVLIGQRNEYEAAFGLVRRALYAYQSAFLPGFHPGKSLVLSSDSLFSSSILRALLLYSHLLAGQGCVRTSLEVMKLVYAMDGGMIRGNPKSHALLHMDTLALKSGQYAWVLKFAVENALTDILPGYALASVLALKQRQGVEDFDDRDPDEIKKIAARKPVDAETSAKVALVRAISVFPDIFRQIIGESSLDVANHTPDPFTYKLIRAVSAKGGVDLVKSNEKLMNWMKDSLRSGGFKKITVKRPDWLGRACGDLTATEFSWGSSSYTEPTGILSDESEIIHMYSNEGVGPVLHAPPTVPTHAVSLDSNPIAAFLQTLLPWATIDTTGTEAAPVTAASLLEHLRATIGLNPTPNERIIEDREEGSSDGSASSSSDEEIVME